MAVLVLYKATERAPGGVLSFDVVTSDTLESSSTATEFPVEVGSNISDHVRSNLDKVTLEVVVSNTPITAKDPLTQSDRGSYNGVTLSLPSAPKQRGLYALLRQGLDMLFGGPHGDPRASLLTFDSDFSATTDTLNLLQQLRREARLLDVVSRDYYAEGMIIESISAPRNSESGSTARFTIGFKQLRIVETRQAQVPLEPKLKRPVAAVVDGKATNKSVAKAIVDKGSALFSGG